MPADRIEDHGLQLSDISGKGIGPQQWYQFLGGGRFFLAEGAGGLFKKVIDEQGEITLSITQGWDMDMVGPEPEIEILTGGAFWAR